MAAQRLKHYLHRLLCGGLAVAGCLAPAWVAAQTAPMDWPDWVAEQEGLTQRIAAVNEGELRFLDREPARAVHHHNSRIMISGASLIDGWVQMEQCHDHLDRVGAAQILFNPGRTRALEVLRFLNMDTAFVEDSAIQLRGVRAGAEVCLRLQSKALHRLDPGVYELQNGPFMRRFLDGFYPLRLSLQIEYPPSLTLVDITPTARPGFYVTQRPGHVGVEAMFEGQLWTRFRFVAR